MGLRLATRAEPAPPGFSIGPLGRSPASSAGRLDAKVVARREVDGRLRRQLPTVQEVAPRFRCAAARGAGGCMGATLGQDRGAAGLEGLHLSHDAVAAAVPALAARAEPQLMAPNSQRIRELERLDRR